MLFAGLMLISACSADDSTAPNAVSPSSKWEEGKHYLVLSSPQPTNSGGKIEVVEVFSYACPHCAHFQPYVDQLKASLPKEAVFTYLPAVFNPSWEPFARAFLTAQSLGVLDRSHQALFDAIHRDRKLFQTIEDLATFYSTYDIKPEGFISTAQSMVIQSQLAKSMEQVRNYQIEGTPTLIVSGKYRIAADPEKGVGYPEMIEIANYLVKKEIAGKK